jgi:hypothetical protein
MTAACGGGGNEATPAPPPAAVTTTLTGLVQKGPFLAGSSIAIQPLDAQLNPTGTSFTTVTSNSAGAFSAANVPQNTLIEITASGFYFDEVRNTNSGAQITLRALARSGTSGATQANANILTSLARQRIVNRVAVGVAFSAAKSQAESEVLAALRIPSAATGFEMLDYAQSSGDSATLLAASAIVQQFAVNAGEATSTVDAELSLFVSQFATDLADNGTIDGATLLDQIDDAIDMVDAAAVAANLTAKYQSLGVTANVPDFNPLLQRLVVLPSAFSASRIPVSGQEPAIVVTPDHVPHVFSVAVGAVQHAWKASDVWHSEVIGNGNVQFARAVADDDGAIYVSAGDQYFFTPTGLSPWQQTTIQAGAIINSSSVSVANDGAVGIAYLSEGGSPNTIRFAAVAGNGSIASEYVADTGLQLEDSTIGHSVCLAFDSHAAPHIFWNDRGTQTQGLRHATRVSGQWVISTLENGPVETGCSVVAEADVLHVTFSDITTRTAPVLRQFSLSGSDWTEDMQVRGTTLTPATLVLPSGAPALVTNSGGGVAFVARLRTMNARRTVSAQQSYYLDAKYEAATGRVHAAFVPNGTGELWYAVSN